MRIVRRRSLVFLVSDFISAPGWERPLAHLARRHEILAVRLSDPLEMELPDLGSDRDPGLPKRASSYLSTPTTAASASASPASPREREALIRGGLQRAGVDALELSTEDDLADALIRFADLRKQHSRLAAGRAPAGVGGAA